MTAMVLRLTMVDAMTFSDYPKIEGAQAVVNGKLIPLEKAALVIAESGMKLSAGAETKH